RAQPVSFDKRGGGFTNDLNGRALLGLGLALEEELALLPGETELDTGDTAHGQEPDLLSLIRQKEKDLVLAARLGKALLERNQDLTRQYEKMHRELSDKLEHLEQEKHELRRRFENREGEWESRVAELESDVRQLQEELERQQAQLREADREKTKVVKELTEQNQRLLEQLNRVTEVERQLTLQIQSLRDEFREKSISSSQHMSRLEILQAEIKMLSDRKQELEQRVGAVLEDNDILQGTIDALQERTLLFERQSNDKDLQLRQNQVELQEVRLAHRQLAARMEELSEERSLRSLGSTSTSLLSEIEQSMEAEELEQEREQLRLQLWEAYCQVRALCSQLRGNDITDSALSTDSSMDESSDTSSAKDVPAGSLHNALHELNAALGFHSFHLVFLPVLSQGSRRSDEDALEEQVKKMSEEMRVLREKNEEEQQKVHLGQEELLQLQHQLTLMSQEMIDLKEEREQLKTTAEERAADWQLQKAIHDRDEAISKKNAVEKELAKCKSDIMSLNSQLLDAIQQKLNLSQQLEAWQDDMHRVIDQQLMDKHQAEWREPPYSFSNSAGRRGCLPPSAQLEDPACGGAEAKCRFSFFKKN
uniref:BICD family like cargo adaptor 1 n=1 Tax=Erpetoichthys calabaricus TaxID=27687 RepID=A0A8C4T3C2_ERPCA